MSFFYIFLSNEMTNICPVFYFTFRCEKYYSGVYFYLFISITDKSLFRIFIFRL